MDDEVVYSFCGKSFCSVCCVAALAQTAWDNAVRECERLLSCVFDAGMMLNSLRSALNDGSCR